jgi:hypothetical protein
VRGWRHRRQKIAKPEAYDGVRPTRAQEKPGSTVTGAGRAS